MVQNLGSKQNTDLHYYEEVFRMFANLFLAIEYRMNLIKKKPDIRSVISRMDFMDHIITLLLHDDLKCLWILCDVDW